MKAMRERNQVMVAIVGTVVVAAVVLLSMNLNTLPFLNPQTTYHADFANADGLKSGDDVRVEGISVGSVAAVHVQGDHVHVDFTVKSGLRLGDTSEASIEVATVLGELFLQVESSGSGRLTAGATIPVSRTTVPYTLITAFEQLGTFGSQTDLPKLQASLKTLAASIAGIAPADAKAALAGLADIARTLAGKQDEISQVLTAAGQITDLLNSKSSALVALLTQSQDFLALLQQREQVITSLLQNTAELGSQLSALIARNGAQLAPLLASLHTVTDVLTKDRVQLQQAVVNLGQFSINIANATGSGPWLDLLSPVAVTPDNVTVACGPHPNAANGPCG